MRALRTSPSHADPLYPAPRLMLAATTPHSGWAASRAASSSSARSWSEGYDATHGGVPPHSAAPLKRVNTCIAMSFAPGATPATGLPGAPVPWPAAMPATWVPWSQRWTPPLEQRASASMSALSSSVVPSGHSDCWLLPRGLEEQYCATTRPPRNGWSTSTPVSRTATVAPAPVSPLACASSARMTGSVLSRVSRSGRSTCTARTCGARRSRSREEAGTVATRWGERRRVRVTEPTRLTASVTVRVLAIAS